MSFNFKLICIIYILNAYGITPDYVKFTPNRNPSGDSPYAAQFTRLQKSLLSNYKPYGRPVKNISTTVNVNLFTVITKLLAVDEETQTVAVNGFMRMEWDDEYLKWDIHEYEDVNQISVARGYIWAPDVMLYSSAVGADMGAFMGPGEKATVNSTGRVTVNSRFKLKSTCFFDFSDYPYDTQVCPLVFGSWSYTLKMMDLIPLVKNRGRSFPIYEMTNNDTNGWQLIDYTANVSYWNAYNKVRTDVKPLPSMFHLVFPEYTVWLKFRRLAPYYGALVLAPAYVTSAFTLVFYWLPSDGLSMVLSLTNTALQMMFADNLLRRLPPANEDSAPRIVKYYAINLTCTVLSAIIFAILSEMTKRKKAKMVKSSKLTIKSPPKILNHFANARQNLVGKLDARLGFQRQVDETGHGVEGEQQKQNLSEIPISSNQMIEDRSEMIENQKQWLNIIEGMRFFAFILFLIVYFASALFLLI